MLRAVAASGRRHLRCSLIHETTHKGNTTMVLQIEAYIPITLPRQVSYLHLDMAPCNVHALRSEKCGSGYH
jgi:hypothetical protein